MQSPSKVFQTQNETRSACVMNLDVKSYQVKCGSSNLFPKAKR